MGTIRGKFRCSAVTYHGDPDKADTPRTYEMSAVYDTTTPENARFAKATPWGELKMRIDNPAARLTPMKDYYLDFTPCDEAVALNQRATTYTTDAGYLAEAPDAATQPVVASGTYTSGE